MAGEWRQMILGDLVDISHGFAFQGEYFRDEPPGDVLLTPGNFRIGGGYKGDKLKYYVGPVPDEFVLNDGDLLVTMTDLSKEADTLGYPAVVPTSSNQRFLHNQRLGKVIVRDGAQIDTGFLFYLLCTREYRHEVVASATGTTVKHTSPTRIKAFKAQVPPLPIQRAIAHILGTLDDKIELNRRMNETLEAMARALFKSWFVDFDPVRAKMEGRKPAGMDMVTAAMFPDSFQDSPLGRLPKGWNVGSLGDVGVNPRRGIDPSEIHASTPYIALEHMPRRSIALNDWAIADGIASGKFEFHRGEILFGKLRPYFHKVGLPAIDGVCSTDILVIVPRSPLWFGFLLGHASSDDLVAYTDATSTGTKMPRTNWSDIARYQVVLPPATVAEALTTITRPLVEHMHSTIHQSRTLAALRDALLPKLLSGEIRVEDAEKLVESRT